MEPDPRLPTTMAAGVARTFLFFERRFAPRYVTSLPGGKTSGSHLLTRLWPLQPPQPGKYVRQAPAIYLLRRGFVPKQLPEYMKLALETAFWQPWDAFVPPKTEHPKGS